MKDYSKLPKWAQHELEQRDGRIQALEEALASVTATSDMVKERICGMVETAAMGHSIPFYNRTRVEFGTYDPEKNRIVIGEDRFCVYYNQDEKALHVCGDYLVDIQPVSGNYLTVKTRPRG